MSPLLISIAIFLGVAGLVAAIALLLRGGAESRVEGRLAQLTGAKATSGAKDLLKESSVLSQPLDATQGMLEEFLAKFRNLTLYFQQADTTVTPSRFFTLCAILAGGAIVTGAAFGISVVALPFLALF